MEKSLKIFFLSLYNMPLRVAYIYWNLCEREGCYIIFADRFMPQLIFLSIWFRLQQYLLDHSYVQSSIP